MKENVPISVSGKNTLGTTHRRAGNNHLYALVAVLGGPTMSGVKEVRM